MTDRRFSAPVTIKARGSAGEVTAVFSTADVVDSVGDRVLSSAFKDGQHVPLVWAHDWSRPVGRGIVKVEPTRAVFEGRFFTETTAGRDAYLTVKAMSDLQEWSFGFQTRDAVPGASGENVIRDLELYEVSPVLVGANRSTHTLAVKRAATAERPTLPPVPERPTFEAVRRRCLEAEVRGRVPYLRIGLLDVPSEVHRTAKATLKACAADLGLSDPPWLEYFIPGEREALLAADVRGRYLDVFEEPEPIFGQYRHGRPGQILLRADRAGRDLVRTVAHETRHAWQRVAWGPRRAMDVDLITSDEDDADAYGAAVQAWYDQGGMQ